MSKKNFSMIVFISSIIVLVFSILGLIMLNLTYLSVTTQYIITGTTSVLGQVNYSGYQLIFDNVSVQVEAEPLLHFIGFIFFLVGSLVFVTLSIINLCSKDSKKKIELDCYGVSKNRKALKVLIIVSTVLLVVIAILVIVFGFLCAYSGSGSVSYKIGAAKVISAFLLGLNFLILAFNLDSVFCYASVNLPKESEKVEKTK